RSASSNYTAPNRATDPPFFFSSRRRHTRWPRDWSSDVCSSDLSPCWRRASGRRFDGPAHSAGTLQHGERDATEQGACLGAHQVEIGRASCRERVENAVVGGALKRKKAQRL